MKESGRVEYVAITDNEAVDAFKVCTKTEGIIPALEPSHAIAHLINIAPNLPKKDVVIVNLCGRGDKDIFTIAEHLNMEI